MKWVVINAFRALAVFFLIPSAAFGQSDGVIRGIVTAKADRSAIAGADVEISNGTASSPLRVKTDTDGSFAFPRLLPGAYTLSISHDGFQKQTKTLSVKPREIQNLTIELDITGITQTVDVRTSSVLTDTYSPNSTVLQKDIVEDLPAGQRNNLPDMIATTAPGMIRGHDDFVHVRGHEIALNTFINGVSFWENPHTVFSGGLTPNIVETANIMTGDFPAEYGNRFGGVVDIVTKTGRSMNNEGSLTVSAGNALRHSAAFEWGGHTEKTGLYLYGLGFESARFLSPNDPRSIHDTGRGAHGFVQLDHDFNASDNVKLVLMGDGTNFQIPKTSLDDEVRPGINAFERTRQQSAILTWSHSFSKDSLLTTSAYERWSQMRLLPSQDPLAAVAENDRRLLTTGIKSDLTRFFGRHTVKGGIDLVMLRPDENLFYDGEGYTAFSDLVGLPPVVLRGPDGGPITFSQDEIGGQGSIYLQDTVQVTSRFKIDAGLRFDRYRLATSATHWSPRLNLAYRLNESGTVVHASYNHFFVPPAVENVLISSGGLTQYLEEHPEPLPPLRPIVEDQAEIGISQPLAGGLRAGVSGYYRLSDNPVHTVLFPDSRIYAYANFDKGKAYGMEVKLEAPGLAKYGLTPYLNYALSRVYFWNPVNAGFVDEAHHLEESGRFLAPMDQTHTLNAGVRYQHRRSGLWGAVTFEYGSGTPTEAEDEDTPGAEPAPLRVPGHFTQNLTVGMDLFRNRERRGVGLQFNIENLTNNVYIVSQESTFSAGEYFNPRFFSGTLKVRF